MNGQRYACRSGIRSHLGEGHPRLVQGYKIGLDSVEEVRFVAESLQNIRIETGEAAHIGFETSTPQAGTRNLAVL